jgi:ribosomal peptide maturation radical SAM protein 1
MGANLALQLNLYYTILSKKRKISNLFFLPEKEKDFEINEDQIMRNQNLKIGLITMPQTLTAMPSIGLTQLASIVPKKYEGKVTTDIIYANLDFIDYIGFKNYQELEASNLTEWMFRYEAFPGNNDNISEVKEALFQDAKTAIREELFNYFLEKRKGIKTFLRKILFQYHLIQYDVIGFTSVTSQNVASFALAKMIKKVNAKGIIVMGGPNCDYPMGKVIIDKIEDIDYVFSGPAIISFSFFIDCLLQDNIDGTHKLDGVFSKKNTIFNKNMNAKESDKNKDYMVKPFGEYHDINMCIELNYDDFLNKFDRFSQLTGSNCDPILLFETSRGCWKRDEMRCNFCGFSHTRYASIEPGLAVEYINHLLRKYADRCSIFESVDCIINKKYLKKVIPYLEVPSEAVIIYETRVTLTKEEMNICSESGLEYLQPGIESLNSNVLNLMQKGISAFTNIRFLKNCIETGIYPIWNILYGLPNEHSDSYFKKFLNEVPLFKHLPPPAGYQKITLVRYSNYFDHADKYGLRLEPHIGNILLYPFHEEDIFNLVYSFSDTTNDADYIKISEEYSRLITPKIVDWMSDFRIDSEFPKLYFKTGNTILDSRFNIHQPSYYDITSFEYDLLHYLNNPHTFDEIETEFSHISSGSIQRALARFNKNKLLFEEDNRYLSLVCSTFAWKREKYLKLIDIISLHTTSPF